MCMVIREILVLLKMAYYELAMKKLNVFSGTSSPMKGKMCTVVKVVGNPKYKEHANMDSANLGVFGSKINGDGRF